jgi:hypothetical protein
MQTKIFSTLSFFIFIVFISSCTNTAKLRKLQEKFLPDAVSNTYIGMPLKDLRKTRGINNLSVNEGKTLTVIKEEYTKDNIVLIQYQFGKNKLLYEIIIEYIPEFDTKAVFKEKYGEPNNVKEWLFILGKDMKLKIWIYQNRLCIADSKHFNI